MDQKEILGNQEVHWNQKFTQNMDMFGTEPSNPAKKTLEVYQSEKASRILELGAGQGRDTIYFAKNDLQVDVLDYSPEGVNAILQKAETAKLAKMVSAQCHDVRKPLPYKDQSFDGCYSHMLFCMAFSTQELEQLCEEVRRVLKPGGLCIYTVRHTGDADYQNGVHRGEDLWESGGFIVHFFDRQKVQHLAKGFEIVDIEEFEEGKLPRKLFRVTLRKL
jgi:SAM-dependent methyltransferase